MQNKTNGLIGAHLGLNDRRRAWHETTRLLLGLLGLGVVCVAVPLLALPLRALLPRALATRLGRSLAAASARIYLGFLTMMGACRFDLSALDALQGAPAMVIAPNHPSLLDAVMILSRLSGATCIIKADIFNSVIFGAVARLSGFIRNTPLRAMVHSAVAELQHGSHVLLFPEGTRTTRFPIGRVQGTTGLIAKKAGVPVQTVLIETDSGFLGKGWPLLRTPPMPITYRIRLGRRFDAPSHSANFLGELERYFATELAHPQGRDAPVSGPPA